MNKQKATEILKEANALEGDEIVKSVNHSGFDCWEIETNYAKYLIGEEKKLENYYAEGFPPSEILYLEPVFLASELNLPQDLLDPDVLEAHYEDDEFAEQILNAVGRNYHDILHHACATDGVAHMLGYDCLAEDIQGMTVLKE